VRFGVPDHDHPKAARRCFKNTLPSVDDRPERASHELFAKMLAVWDDLEVGLRAEYGYQGCVMGADHHCPKDTPVSCSACQGASLGGGGTPVTLGPCGL
jgi:hypothetical protein